MFPVVWSGRNEAEPRERCVTRRSLVTEENSAGAGEARAESDSVGDLPVYIQLEHMSEFLERITVFCFAASYGVALALEVWHLLAPRRILRLIAVGFAAAGLLAHFVYLAVQPLPLATPQGSLLFLAWILAFFSLSETIHHARQAWGLFVLPLVLTLIALSVLVPARANRNRRFGPGWPAHAFGVRFTGSWFSWQPSVCASLPLPA